MRSGEQVLGSLRAPPFLEVCDLALYYVALPNPYFRQGAFVEEIGDGFVQEVRMGQHEGRAHAGGWMGLCVPYSGARKYLLQVRKYGVDKEQIPAAAR